MNEQLYDQGADLYRTADNLRTECIEKLAEDANLGHTILTYNERTLYERGRDFMEMVTQFLVALNATIR